MMSAVKFVLVSAFALMAGSLAAQQMRQITPLPQKIVRAGQRAGENFSETSQRELDEKYKNRSCTAQELYSIRDTEVIRYLLKTRKADPNMKVIFNSVSGGGEPLIVNACRRGDYRLAKLLAEFGADCPDWPDVKITVLHAAALNGHLPLVQALLDAGFDPNEQDLNGANTLFYARTIPVLKLLIRRGAEFSSQDSRRGRYLDAAIRGGNLDVVKLLAEEYPRESGAENPALLIPLAVSSSSIPVTDYLFAVSNTKKASLELLLFALRGANVAMFRHLIQTKSAPVNDLTAEGEGVLSTIVRCYSDKEMFKFAVDSGADPKNPAAQAMILCAASTRGGRELIEWLLDTYKMNINAASPTGMTPLISATGNQSLDMIRFLLDKGALPAGTVRESGTTALSNACSRGLDDIVKRLLDLGAQPDVWIAEQNSTPLILAVRRRRIAIVRLLLEHGAKPDFCGKGTDSPLSAAILSSADRDMIQLLLKHGADPNVSMPGGDGMFPLTYTAIYRRNYQKGKSPFEPLIACDKIQIDIRDADGNTPLHFVAQMDPDTIGQLLAKGADVNAKNKNGETPLHRIAASENELGQEIAKLLLAKGASPRIKNNAGKLPCDLTVNQEMRKILEPGKK